MKRALVFAALITLLFLTRFYGIDWGLPYPMNPDEHNIVRSIQRLSCPDTEGCFNPHFYAYGQFTIYLGYGVASILSFFDTGLMGSSIKTETGILAIRVISATSSIISAFLLFRIVVLILKHEFAIQNTNFISMLIGISVIFTPVFIQFSHYGTTESLLILYLVFLLNLGYEYLYNRIGKYWFYSLSGIVIGVAIGTKLTGLMLCLVPFLFIISSIRKTKKHIIYDVTQSIAGLTIIAVLGSLFAVITSPYNILNYQDFLSSMRYETGVGVGDVIPFYTRQFQYTIPVIFHIERVFPFALGLGFFFSSVVAFFVLPWSKNLNILRTLFLVVFFSQGFIYAKWIRFMVYSYPLLMIFAILLLVSSFVYKQGFYRKYIKISTQAIIGLLILISILPGMAYYGLYSKPDVRFQASQWMFEQFEPQTYLLAETANIVNLPIQPPNSETSPIPVNHISFDFYHLHENARLRSQLEDHIENADYILIPSRRIFANHTCLNYDTIYQNTAREKTALIEIDQKLKVPFFDNMRLARCEFLLETYSDLNEYYQRLFSGQLGFELKKEFQQYPTIYVFGYPLISFPDEWAEETWSVFDHPVVRVYGR